MHNKRFHNRPGYFGAFSKLFVAYSLWLFNSPLLGPARRVKRSVEPVEKVKSSFI